MSTVEAMRTKASAIDDAARRFAALGEPVRLALVARLAGGAALSIATLAAATPVTRQAVARHLGVLEQAGLVSAERVGREARYRLQPAGLAATREWLDQAAAQWDDALVRLAAHLDE